MATVEEHLPKKVMLQFKEQDLIKIEPANGFHLILEYLIYIFVCI